MYENVLSLEKLQREDEESKMVGLDLERDADLSVFLRQEKLNSSSSAQKEGHGLLKSE